MIVIINNLMFPKEVSVYLPVFVTRTLFLDVKTNQ